ncbi:MAG: pectinesterase family protein [Rhodobacter sp.]|nr:pectinesterase family protein [Rhodobacter sp.]
MNRVASNPLRPQLCADQARAYDRETVLGAWDPADDTFMAGADNRPMNARWRSEDFPTLQSAVDHAVLDALDTGRTDRIFIAVPPGCHQGPVCLPGLSVNGCDVPFTLFGTGAEASEVEIVARIDARMPGAEYAARYDAHFARSPPDIANNHARVRARDTLSTGNAAVLRVLGDGTQLKNLTIRNAYGCDRATTDPDARRNAQGQLSDETHQAVALLIDGADRVHCENVHLHSHQDTLFLDRSPRHPVSRSYFRNCLIEGDVDFIFGPALGYFQACEVRSLGSRSPNSWATAPSTDIRDPYGFVFDYCDFTHDGSETAPRGRFRLGRQWFCGVRATPYGTAPIAGYQCRLADISEYTPPAGTISRTTLMAVGKCAILRSRIGAHINAQAPWDDWKGGQYRADGSYHNVAWDPRFRPVQFTADDIGSHLADWQDLGHLDLTTTGPGRIFLAEFENIRSDTRSGNI